MNLFYWKMMWQTAVHWGPVDTENGDPHPHQPALWMAEGLFSDGWYSVCLKCCSMQDLGFSTRIFYSTEIYIWKALTNQNNPKVQSTHCFFPYPSNDFSYSYEKILTSFLKYDIWTQNKSILLTANGKRKRGRVRKTDDKNV
jgi:hypothetical protein